MAQINLFNTSGLSTLKNRKQLKTFLIAIAVAYKRPILSLNIIFCDDDYLLSINKGFLAHDYYTDIITFDLSASTNDAIQGELYISTDRVRDNAQTHNQRFITELHRVIFHGLLHLLGYKDKSEKDSLKMKEMEDILLSQYFVS
jgi:probable rRNA maturation factor